MGRQIHEQEPALAARQLFLDATTFDPRGEPSAELDSRARLRRQGFTKVLNVPVRHNEFR